MATEPLPPTRKEREESVADSIRRVINGVQELIDRQIELAKQELKENVIQVGKASGLLLAGGVLLFLTVIFLLITIILVVEAIFPGRGWIAAVVITLLLGVIGFVLVTRGKDRIKISPLRHTRETLKEDIEWAKRPLKRDKK